MVNLQLQLNDILKQIAQQMNQSSEILLSCKNEVESNIKDREQSTDIAIEASIATSDDSVGIALGMGPTPVQEELETTSESCSEFETELFIEQVRAFPCLWNTSLSSYKDKTAKTNAWEGISKIFKKDGMDS